MLKTSHIGGGKGNLSTPRYKLLVFLACSAWLTQCSMPEEARRIERVNQLERHRQATSGSDLSGQQTFLRSCNTCHPGGRQGLGPALDKLSGHFSDDKSLKALIRSGKGMMPAQPASTINVQELDNLVAYLRALKL